ncbi:MAG: heavy-metal-associated domain-containing protein [Janthinobacterium lividum]
MQTLKFKTNINCGGCIKAVTPTLNREAGAGNWQVDTANPDKILTISAPQLSAAQVVQAVEQAGFQIQAA